MWSCASMRKTSPSGVLDILGLLVLDQEPALARWVRRTAATAPWAGAGIPLNAIAPGTVLTPMTAPMLTVPGIREVLDAAIPMPLRGHATAEEVAPLLDFLTSPENTHVTGQIVFIDGGADAAVRGEGAW